MVRGSSTASFICELPLVLSGDDERVLGVRLDCARQVYNAVLGESLRRLALLRQSKAYKAARTLPRRTKEERKARAAASSPVSVQAFVAWARDQQPASAAPSGGSHLSNGGSERVAGAVVTRAREGADAVPPQAGEPGRARRVATRTPGF